MLLFSFCVIVCVLGLMWVVRFVVSVMVWFVLM